LADEELARLLEEARKRTPEALAELCELFYPKVLKYMHYRVAAQHAEDLTEEVFLRVVRSIQGQTGSFNAWLYRVAANVVAQWYRQKKRRDCVGIEEIDGELASAADGPGETVPRHLDLTEAIGQLTDDQREFVTLKFIQGLSNADIAEITGRSPEAIRALQFRALSALRQILDDEKKSHERSN